MDRTPPFLRTELRPEERLLFASTRQDFQECHQAAVADLARNREVCWDRVFSLAESHGVAPLLYVNWQSCPDVVSTIPPGVLVRFQRCAVRNLGVKEKMARTLADLLTFCRRKSLDVMAVKGSALDLLVYRQPWYTVSQDVDVILRPRREELSDPDRREINALFQTLPHVELEYHEHHDLTMNGALGVNFARVWRDAVPARFRGQDVLVMSPEDILIAACVNCCRKRFFRLKALCDIAEIIRTFPDLKWQEIMDKAREYQCNNIVYAALVATDLTLGCDRPEGVLGSLAVNPVRAALLRFLSRRLARHSLSSLSAGVTILGKRLSLSLLLPYAVYHRGQAWRNLGSLYGQWRVRSLHAALHRPLHLPDPCQPHLLPETDGQQV